MPTPRPAGREPRMPHTTTGKSYDKEFPKDKGKHVIHECIIEEVLGMSICAKYHSFRRAVRGFEMRNGFDKRITMYEALFVID